jgi:outer membrane protein
MKLTRPRVSNSFSAVAFVALSFSFASFAYAQNADVTIEGPPNTQLGLAVAAVPDYWGSDDSKGVIAPIARYQFSGTERYLSWMGPTIKANLLDDRSWNVGPLLKFRAKRDNDVEDDVVKRMDEVDAVVEAGGFVDYMLPLSNEKGHALVFGADVEGSKNGTEANLRVTYRHPFSEALLGSIGVGVTYGNDKLAETYFGVTSPNDVAVFGGQRFEASAGIVSWNVPVILTYRYTPTWTLIGVVRFEQLQGDAKDSPVVSQRGDENQFVAGVGFSYLF